MGQVSVSRSVAAQRAFGASLLELSSADGADGACPHPQQVPDLIASWRSNRHRAERFALRAEEIRRKKPVGRCEFEMRRKEGAQKCHAKSRRRKATRSENGKVRKSRASLDEESENSEIRKRFATRKTE